GCIRGSALVRRCSSVPRPYLRPRELPQSPNEGSGILSHSENRSCTGTSRSSGSRHPLQIRFPQWLVHLRGDPQPVEKNRKLSRHHHNRTLLRSRAPFVGQPQAPSPQVRVRSERTQDVVGRLNQESSQQNVPLLVNRQLRGALSRIVAAGNQSDI